MWVFLILLYLLTGFVGYLIAKNSAGDNYAAGEALFWCFLWPLFLIPHLLG